MTYNHEWFLPGKYFDNKEMDDFRLSLLRLQHWCNNLKTREIPIKLWREWIFLDGTHSVRGATFKFLNSEKFTDFQKKNKRDYRGVFVQNKNNKLYVIVTAGTDPTSFQNLRADKRLFFNTVSKSYCQAGQLFTEYVRNEYGQSLPNAFVAHSLGCCFNMWINAYLEEKSYILNIDAFTGSKSIHETCCKYFPRVSKNSSHNNIDSILGSKNCLNNQCKGHVGHICKVKTTSINSIERHAIDKIGDAYEKELKKRRRL